MTATSQDIDTKRLDGAVRSIPLKADEVIYAGTLVMRSTSNGYGYAGADSANAVFAGIAEESVDATGEDDGAVEVRVRRHGVFMMLMAAVAITDIGKKVFLSDNQTVAFTGTTNAIYVGRVVGVYSSTYAWVEISELDILVSELASIASGKGASMVGVEDSAAHFAGADVETVLAEIATDYEGIITDLASVANGDGAALVGVEDADTYFTGADVEAVLAELGEGRVYHARGTIAAAAVATLHATPVELIAAPGDGKFIEVERIHWWLDFASAGYDAAAAGDTLLAKYTDDSGDAVVDAVAGDAIGAAVADYHTLVSRVAELIPVANAAIVAHIATGEWYAAAGDSPLKYEAVYRIRDLAFAVA